MTETETYIFYTLQSRFSTTKNGGAVLLTNRPRKPSRHIYIYYIRAETVRDPFGIQQQFRGETSFLVLSISLNYVSFARDDQKQKSVYIFFFSKRKIKRRWTMIRTKTLNAGNQGLGFLLRWTNKIENRNATLGDRDVDNL